MSKKRRHSQSRDGTASSVLSAALLAAVQERFELDWHGVHGIHHWRRVRENGLRIARATGANVRVVELFSHVYDVCRENEGGDPGHGRRAAAYVEELRAAELVRLSEEETGLLVEACTYHSNGRTRGEVTVLTCWDADRLDLGRVGIRPDPKCLCTAAAREARVLAWAWERRVRPG